jgi:hypothetical protein
VASHRLVLPSALATALATAGCAGVGSGGLLPAAAGDVTVGIGRFPGRVLG